MMTMRAAGRLLLKTLLGLSVMTGVQNITAQVKTAAPVIVEVFNSTAVLYSVPWTPNMSVLNAMEQALPTTSPSGSFSVNYFPQFGGYFVSAVGSVPAPGVAKFWSTCLLPAASGSTIFSLPLGPNRVVVGPGDTVVLAFDSDCTKVPPIKK